MESVTFVGMFVVLNENASVVLMLLRLLGAGIVELTVPVIRKTNSALSGPATRLNVSSVV